MTLPALVVCGSAGGLLFKWLHLPGGAMVGSLVAVVLANSLVQMPVTELPESVSTAIYIALGMTIGCMYRPGMLAAVGSQWPTLLISTLVILLAGMFSAWLVWRSGVLDPVGAYLATSPGGLNVLTGLAAEMGQNAPLVLVYQLVRLYAILIMAPFVAPFIEKWLRLHP